MFLFFFDFDDFASFVVAAVGADGVGKAHGAAVGAEGEVAGFECVVSAAVVAAALGVFAFWMWGHGSFSLMVFFLVFPAGARRGFALSGS